MTKLPDEKLIDKIMEDISNFTWINDLEDIVVPVYRVEQILQKHLTNPTDEGIEKEETTKCGHNNHEKRYAPFCLDCNRFLLEEVKPPTKDTIEKIGDFKDLYSFPNNPRVGQTCAGYIWNGEHRLEQGFDYMKFECLRTKYNELVDTVNHQQEQIQQLLSGTDKNE